VLPFHPHFLCCQQKESQQSKTNKKRIQAPSLDQALPTCDESGLTYCRTIGTWRVSSLFIRFPLLDMGCTRGGYIYIYQTISESIINEFFLRTTAAEALDIFFISKRGEGHNNSTRSLSLTHQRSPDSTCDFPSARQLHVNNRN
jgi:hypothetical protein